MTKRTTYDQVEALAIKARREGHDIKLYFNYDGVLAVFHDGEEVLSDKGRSYDVALAKVRQILMNSEPQLEKNPKVLDTDVQRGRSKRSPAKKKPPTLKDVKKAKVN